MEVKWIKIVTDIFDDEKILLIESMPEADGIIVIWFKLLCLAGKQNNSGVFMLNDKIAYIDEMLATIFRRPLTLIRLALKVFEQFDMIEVIDGTITIPNWEKHQSLAKLESAKQLNRERVAKCRQKQKLLVTDAKCNDYSNVTVIDCNDDVIKSNADRKRKEIDIDSEIDKDKEIKITKSQADAEFEEIWKLYPNKKGKAKSLTYFKKAREKGVAFETIKAGVENYAIECQIRNRDIQYIKNGSTWFGNECWNDEYNLTPQQEKTEKEAPEWEKAKKNNVFLKLLEEYEQEEE